MGRFILNISILNITQWNQNVIVLVHEAAATVSLVVNGSLAQGSIFREGFNVWVWCRRHPLFRMGSNERYGYNLTLHEHSFTSIQSSSWFMCSTYALSCDIPVQVICILAWVFNLKVHQEVVKAHVQFGETSWAELDFLLMSQTKALHFTSLSLVLAWQSTLSWAGQCSAQLTSLQLTPLASNALEI